MGVETSVAGPDMKQAFPNPVHRMVYRAMHLGVALNADMRSGQEARSLGALQNIPGLVYDDEDRARIDRVRQARREEIYAEGMRKVDLFMLEHGLGSAAFHSEVLMALDD